MTEQQKAVCDGFVYIKQYGPGTASLNVAVAASIVMHNFSIWANFPERTRTGEKFDVAERPPRTSKQGVAYGLNEGPESVKMKREMARKEARMGDEHGVIDSLF